MIPVFRRIFADQLTPVLAYRRLVREDDREAPSFLFESVEHGVAGSRQVGGRLGVGERERGCTWD